MASDQEKEAPWGDSAPGSATGRPGPSPCPNGVPGPSNDSGLPLSIFTAELDADVPPPHASVIDIGPGTSQPPINTPLRRRASTEFTGPIVTGASVLKHYLTQATSRPSANVMQHGGRVEPADSPTNNGGLLSHTERMQSGGGGGGTGGLLSTLTIAQNVHRQNLFMPVKTTPLGGDTSRDEMDWDADHPDSLGQLERLLVVLGMRVGSRSQVIWGVILLSFNTYRSMAAFALAYVAGDNPSLSCMSMVVGIFHLLITLYQSYYFMYFPQTSLLRLYSNFVPCKSGSQGQLDGEEKRALRREINALIRPLLPAIYMACIFNPITLIVQYIILIMSENPATSLRSTAALTGYPWISSFYSSATYWFFLVPITGIWLTSNLLFYIAGKLLLRHCRELIDDVRRGTVTVLDLWHRHHELCCAIRRADYLFSGYSDAHMALNGTMIIFIINALIFYDTTPMTKAMLVWYCVGTSALLGLWVVLAAATHSTHRTVLQQVLWGIDMEQWSQSDHSQLRTLLWKMTYTDPGLMLGRRKLKFTWQVAIRFASILTTAFVFVFQVYKIVTLSGRMALPEDPTLPKT